jgi:hypothetical protein
VVSFSQVFQPNSSTDLTKCHIKKYLNLGADNFHLNLLVFLKETEDSLF